MNKMLTILLCTMLLSACGSGSVLTLQSFTDAYEAEGISVDKEEKPFFTMIGATDGVIFYMDNNPVKIYEFEDKQAMDAVNEVLPVAADWERNGLFLLETSDTKATEVFQLVE